MKGIVSEILFESFFDNKSVNFVVKQDHKKDKRLKTLIEYSIFMGENFGKIYLSDDKKACAIVLDPAKKKTTLKGILWDIKLAFGVIGISNVGKVMARESVLKKYHPKTPFMHLWYIGVKNEEHSKGLGSKLLQQIINDNPDKDIYLETSTERNFPFYKKHGFELVDDLVNELGYHLHMYIHKLKK
jgi:ribosomal protein S18 acetylase RimI-like enzyme